MGIMDHNYLIFKVEYKIPKIGRFQLGIFTVRLYIYQQY